MADYCDQRGCKVRTLSTPVTIYRDLQGIREAGDHNTYRANPYGAPNNADGLVTPERLMLQKIGRLDLLA